MAGLNSHDSKAKKPLRKPLMLKDYLLDDLSSCSSNGFRSYPRRQCCTTVRFLVDVDLNTTDSSGHGKRFLKSKSKSASTTKMSAFQRASEAVINAVKFLPFASTKSPSSASKQKKTKSSILPRSLSRKLLRRSFRKKTDKDMQQSWKSFMYFLEQKYPSDSSPSAALTSATTSTVTTASYSNSSVSETNSNSHSWSESDFTSDSLQSSSGNLDSSGENDVVAGEKPARASKRVGVTVGDDSTEANSKIHSQSGNSYFFISDTESAGSPPQHAPPPVKGDSTISHVSHSSNLLDPLVHQNVAVSGVKYDATRMSHSKPVKIIIVPPLGLPPLNTGFVKEYQMMT